MKENREEASYWSEIERRRKSRGRVNLRVSDEELAELKKRAELSEASLSGYVKAAALGAPIPRRARQASPDSAALRQMLGQLGKLGSNANQLARAANAGSLTDYREAKEALEAIRAELAEMRVHLLEALGAEP